MGHQYISLGAACNAATMMKIAGLRRASYPFDWLLNLEDGLTAVTAIINDDFKEISSADCYEVVHYAQVGSAVPVYRQYPRTYHVHSDPRQNQDAHEDMVRRCDRLRQVLKSTDHLHFVYYRNLSACRGDRSGVSAATVYEQMTAEASQFLSTISSRRRGKTSLLLILEADDEDTNEA
ncbi:DUF1796 family putative cysteine peptidase [Agrobacterium rosae]|uniref:DUF1796 family putative cysteine peptidase n=1 Tax=Agrobacterium rosae TaxID=1972867 RepID=A0ABU4VWD8_9HYPH|nr:DUF1796 family putative cysteine peptidase [Agrobacterium rosae]MDX8329606.1 DUF1796 family putative cysteine peptidase [Agrobacterium rosae]